MKFVAVSFLVTSLLIITNISLTGQIYSGKTITHGTMMPGGYYKPPTRDCLLKIINDSSFVLVTNQNSTEGDFNETYMEHFGRITKLNDSTYKLFPKLKFYHEIFMWHLNQVLITINLRKNICNYIRLIYNDGYTIAIKNDSFSYKIPIEKKHYRKSTSKILIDIGHMNPITNKIVMFTTSCPEGNIFLDSDGDTTFNKYINKRIINTFEINNTNYYILLSKKKNKVYTTAKAYVDSASLSIPIKESIYIEPFELYKTK